MASEFPNSFKDPLYAQLDASTEQKLGLPVGLLSSVRVNGEQSNHDQTNGLKTFGVYQFIPATRDAILKKYGIDVTLSPENASKGAGYLLKEGLDRNQGDPAQSVGEYIGGLNRSAWGPQTKAYMNRVMVGQTQQKTGALENGFAKFMANNPAIIEKPAVAPAPTGGSALERGFGEFLANQETPAVNRIPGQDGLPVTAQPTPEIPTSLADKLVGAGETALTLATGATGGALGLARGAIGGIAQSVRDGTFGTQEGAQLAEQSAAQGMQDLTYAPRTASGQAQTEAVGGLIGQAIPVIPLAGELTQAARAAALTKPTAQAVGTMATQRGTAAVKAIPEAVSGAVSAVRERIPGLARETDTGAVLPRGSVGAAATPQDLLRTTKAENLPVTINLTKGATTRDAAQLAFEKEQMKGPLGAPLRARAEENNLQALQNFDTLIDQTEAQAPDFAATGNKVVGALSEGYKAAKNKTNVAYAKARNSPEALLAVDPATVVTIGAGDNALTTSLIDHLNSIPSNLKTTALTDHAKQYAVRLGVAGMGDDGLLVPLKPNVKTMEALRKEISQATGFEPVEIRDSTILKKLIDAQTEPLAGPLYKSARQFREQQARKFENRAIVGRLLTNKKGMEDPTVAVDQVFQKSIINGSPEEITFLKRVLNTSGESGQHAWKELQGATIKHIRDEATKGMGMDSADSPIISPAKLHQVVTTLDKNNRLDIVLGKKGGEIVRDLNDVVRYVNTVPPGTLINNSGTAGTLLAAMAEAGTTGVLTGLPVPILSLLRMLATKSKERKLRARIEEALRGTEQQPIKGQGSKL